MENTVWIFNGQKGRFPSGVFTTREMAETWIQKYKLSGILTLYPINIGVYDWAIDNQYFSPSKDEELQPTFIGSFSTASQQHFHYIDGNVE